MTEKRKRGRPPDAAAPDPADPPPDVREALGLVQQIEETVEGLPERTQERGAEFFEDVLRKSMDVGATVERTGRVSEKQLTALNNWLAGVKKWVREDD